MTVPATTAVDGNPEVKTGVAEWVVPFVSGAGHADAVAATVFSVNVGRPRRMGAGRSAVESAIWKEPVDGRVRVRGVNVDGDDQADRSVHGGPDKAVYVYGIEEIRLWETELDRDLGTAPFGENLTTEGLDVSGAVVGERWTVGTTRLEVAQPRMPCFKLGLRIGAAGFVRRFARASRPGAYLRIVCEGEVGAGDVIEVQDRPAHGVTVRMVADAMFVDPGLIPIVLQASQLPLELRQWLAGRTA